MANYIGRCAAIAAIVVSAGFVNAAQASESEFKEAVGDCMSNSALPRQSSRVVCEAAESIVELVEAAQENDEKKREEFTQRYVDEALKKYPNYNVVVSHNGGKIIGNGAQHLHIEVPMTVGTCGYEIWLLPKGQKITFVRNGDGGFINWAFGGRFNRDGDTVNFY